MASSSSASAASRAVGKAHSSFVRKQTKRSLDLIKYEVEHSGAPKATMSVPSGSGIYTFDQGLEEGSPGVAIRQVGCTRRVFLRKSYLKPDEIEGLAYRMKMLSMNDSINSVLIAPNDESLNPEVLPASLVDIDRHLLQSASEFDIPDAGEIDDQTWHVCGGYDPIQIYKDGITKDSHKVTKLLTDVRNLALSVRGDDVDTLIPVITMPHGLINDSGYALCMGGYVMATSDTSFRMTNPSKGLSFDPVGLSYILPRVGWEFQQQSMHYSRSIALLLALTGYEANASDMMELGLATHYNGSAYTVLGDLEKDLSMIEPWNQQRLLPDPIRMIDEPKVDLKVKDINRDFRNRKVATTLHAYTQYHVTGRDMWTDSGGEWDDSLLDGFDDPSLELDPMQVLESRKSKVLEIISNFNFIFESESTVEGIIEGFRNAASKPLSGKEEEDKNIAVAKDIVDRMEKCSPLALCATYRLLELARSEDETLESCMKREMNVQTKLLQMYEYNNWADYCIKNGMTGSQGDGNSFTDWKHQSVKEVSPDEINELLGE